MPWSIPETKKIRKKVFPKKEKVDKRSSIICVVDVEGVDEGYNFESDDMYQKESMCVMCGRFVWTSRQGKNLYNIKR